MNECTCPWTVEDMGGGVTATVPEYEPSCPVHSEHLFDPRTGEWVLRDKHPRCTHCGEEIQVSPGHALGKHLTGPQTHLGRCATVPYGFNAHPVGTPCVTPCRGEVQAIARDERSLEEFRV